jgi:hypothetical protein
MHRNKENPMKALILALFFVPAFAQAKANIFCKTNAGKVISALSEDGRYECSYALAEGSACFTGPRAEVIDLINGDTFNWDEEWLAGAHFKGRDSIAYKWVDGPNEIEEKLSMNRCDDSFFGK